LIGGILHLLELLLHRGHLDGLLLLRVRLRVHCLCFACFSASANSTACTFTSSPCFRANSLDCCKAEVAEGGGAAPQIWHAALVMMLSKVHCKQLHSDEGG
jgi:hypothetical protein